MSIMNNNYFILVATNFCPKIYGNWNKKYVVVLRVHSVNIMEPLMPKTGVRKEEFHI